MTDEDNPDKPSADKQTAPISESPVSPSTPAQREIPDHSRKITDNQQETAKELAREFRWVEFAQLAVNAALGVIGIFALCIYSGQLKVMQGQLGEIIKQYPELHKSAQAASDSITLTRENAHLDQRAWVGLAVVKIDAAPKENRGPELSFQFVNIGKTPAREVKTKLDWYPSITTVPPFCKDVPRIHYGAPSIAPQGSYTLHDPSTNPSYVENTGGGIQYWEKGESAGGYFCINGQISYADIFSEARHTTHFCVYAQYAAPQKFAYCDYQNDMN